MGHWNYRIFRKRYKKSPAKDMFYYHIAEIYYNNSGKIWGYTEEGQYPFGESPKELKDDLKLMLKALDKTIIDEEKLKKQLAKSDWEK